MKLALGVSLIGAFSLVLLYSILVGVMVPGWKASNGNLLQVLNEKAIAYVGQQPNQTILGNNRWLFATIERTVIGNSANGTVIIAIPSTDFYGNIEHGVVVASCAGLGVLLFLVIVLWTSIHCCVNLQLEAKKRNEVSIPYTIFDEVK